MSSQRQIAETALELLRAAVGISGAPPGDDGRDAAERVLALPLGDLDWHGLVAFASAHLVLPALAQPLSAAAARGAPVPADLVAFLGDMHEANRQRNASLRTAMVDIARALNRAGITPVALKGAAWLTEAGADMVAWRFMRDVDLLVPAAGLPEAVRLVAGLGFAADEANYDPAREAHFPPLISPCRSFSIELHTRLFGVVDGGPAPQELTAAARPALVEGAWIGVPTIRHRIGHLVAHAQLHNRQYAGRRIVLRDLVELAMLPATEIATFEQGLAAAEQIGDAERGAQQALLAALALWRGDGVGDRYPAAAVRWARAALARLAWPKSRALAALPADLVRIEAWRLAHEPGHGRRRLELIASPHTVARAASSWGFKQRQRLWSARWMG